MTISEEEYRALDVVAREFEELAKELTQHAMLRTWGDANVAMSRVAMVVAERASRIRGRLCAHADEEAREQERNLPTSWSGVRT